MPFASTKATLFRVPCWSFHSAAACVHLLKARDSPSSLMRLTIIATALLLSALNSVSILSSLCSMSSSCLSSAISFAWAGARASTGSS